MYEDYRNQGVGSQLLEYAENILRKKDLQAFYAKRGFKHSGKPYFCMWKEL